MCVSQRIITAFREMGGNNLIFHPNDSSVPPVGFIDELTIMFDAAEVPCDKRVSLAVKALKGSAK